MTNEEIEYLEISKKQAQSLINKGEALRRLLKNPDYILVISEGYFKEYPKEIAEAIANNTGAYDADVLCSHLKSINTLKGYEFRVAGNYDRGVQELLDIENTIAGSVHDDNTPEE